nr:DUF6708 domain-containing protein [Pseudomonas sp. Marseille-Q3773]
MNRPLLNPPCPGWMKDLPAPEESISFEAAVGSQVPNHQCPLYLELPRRTFNFRHLLMIYSLLTALATLQLPSLIVDSIHHSDYETALMCVFAATPGLWASLFMFRLSTSAPRDEPIRFNRARRKVYAYNFRYRWWNPFEEWKVVPVSYDWLQVRAELWWRNAALPNGGFFFNNGVVLSIVEPGTNNVIDRFHLSFMGANEHVWAYICTYMQEGPSALPPAGEPKDHNDVLWCEFALRLAPKVSWPAEMDLESRTAP